MKLKINLKPDLNFKLTRDTSDIILSRVIERYEDKRIQLTDLSLIDRNLSKNLIDSINKFRIK